jgi:hypothetical protein
VVDQLKLIDLEPQFLKLKDTHLWTYTDDITEADGICFLCPVCFRKNNGPEGTHSVICWQPKVPPELGPKPGRWELVGTGYEDLSLVAASSSILLTGGCNAHFFIRNGMIE